MNLHVILLNIFKHIEETFDMQTSSKPALDQQYGVHTNVRWIIEFPAAVYKISEIFGQNQCSTGGPRIVLILDSQGIVLLEKLY